MRTLLLAALLMAAAGLFALWRPALAFDDAEFCGAAKTVLRAASVDVGTWTDRLTRHVGIEFGCDQ
jgi:hypothetical protein